MHTLAFFTKNHAQPSVCYIVCCQMQHNMKMIPKLVDKGKGVV